MDKPTFTGLPPEVAEYIARLESQIERLDGIIHSLQKALYGPKSEKARYVLYDGIEQQSLFNEAEVYADAAAESAPEPEKPRRNRMSDKPKRTKEELAKDLPVKTVLIELPEGERGCNICGEELHPIGKELVRREVEFTPASACVVETWRVNYACGPCEDESDQANIIKAPVPVPVIKRGLATPASIAHVIYQKYVNAVPLNRQEADWRNFGLEITRATLANWVIYVCTHWFKPFFTALHGHLLASPVNASDETVVQVLNEPGKTPQSESRMWCYCTGNTGGPRIILFEYQPGRDGKYAAAFLAGFTGYLQTDGYAGYRKVAGVILCGCWAHARRKFEDALPKTVKKDGPALIGLGFCQKLFVLEDKFAGLSAQERLKLRQEFSKPVVDEFYAWVGTINPLAASKLGESITYVINQREPLSVFLLDGRIEISNNRAENAQRGFCVGRKNWLFAETVRGAQSSAIAYSIIETAKANGLNPYQYLLFLLTVLPTVLTKDPNADLTPYLPWSDNLPAECRNTGEISAADT